MKAILCQADDLKIYVPGTKHWRICECGLSAARWVSPGVTGDIIVATRASRNTIRGLGMHNRLLVPAITTPGQAWEDFRDWHEAATNSPGFVFDKSQAGCWAVIFRIGTTSDSRWATVEETEEALSSKGKSDLPISAEAYHAFINKLCRNIPERYEASEGSAESVIERYVADLEAEVRRTKLSNETPKTH